MVLHLLERGNLILLQLWLSHHLLVVGALWVIQLIDCLYMVLFMIRSNFDCGPRNALSSRVQSHFLNGRKVVGNTVSTAVSWPGWHRLRMYIRLVVLQGWYLVLLAQTRQLDRVALWMRQSFRVPSGMVCLSWATIVNPRFVTTILLRILNLNCKRHWWRVLKALSSCHLTHELVSTDRCIIVVSLGLLLLELLDVVSVLGSLLDHRIELLLGHLNNWQFSHLRVSNYGRLLQKLVL